MVEVNSVWPSDAIWWYWSGSTWAQIMAWCHEVPSHYLNLCWLIIRKVQWHSSDMSEDNFTRDTSAFNCWKEPWNYSSKISFKSLSGQWVNSLAPGRFQFNFRQVIFKLILVNGGWGISYEIALRWMPLDLTDDKSTLVQVMAWCRQTTSHYLSQCWPRSVTKWRR